MAEQMKEMDREDRALQAMARETIRSFNATMHGALVSHMHIHLYLSYYSARSSSSSSSSSSSFLCSFLSFFSFYIFGSLR